MVDLRPARRNTRARHPDQPSEVYGLVSPSGWILQHQLSTAARLVSANGTVIMPPFSTTTSSLVGGRKAAP